MPPGRSRKAAGKERATWMSTENWSSASSASPAVARGTTNRTVWLKFHLPYYFGWPSSSLHASGSHCTAVPGSAARLGLHSIGAPSERSFLGRRAVGDVFIIFPHSSFLGLQQ